MARGIKRGTRRAYWSVLFGERNFTWVDPAYSGYNNCMTKREVEKFLRTFNTSDWPQYDIISVKILHHRRLGTTSMWDTETMGYTDVTPEGKLYDIKL